MKKAILLLFICAALSAKAQPKLYINSKLSYGNLGAVKDYIAAAIGSEFTITRMDISFPNQYNEADFDFNNRAKNEALYVKVHYQTVAAADHGGTGNGADTVISNINIRGRNAAVFKVYQQAFAPNADFGLISKTKKGADTLLLLHLGIYNEEAKLSLPDDGNGTLDVTLTTATAIYTPAAATTNATATANTGSDANGPVKWDAEMESLYGTPADKRQEDYIRNVSENHYMARFVGFVSPYGGYISQWLVKNRDCTLAKAENVNNTDIYVLTAKIGEKPIRITFALNKAGRIISGRITGTFEDMVFVFSNFWDMNAVFDSFGESLRPGVAAEKHSWGDLISFRWDGASPYITITRDPNKATDRTAMFVNPPPPR